MTEPTTIDNPGGAPVIAWGAEGIDANAMEQAQRTARMPFVHDHLALMADAHLGIGATIGSVIATDGAIIPAACGVDLGCGMIAVCTDLSAAHLPDDLASLHGRLVAAIPAGMGRGHEHEAIGAEWVARQEHRPPLLDAPAKRHPLDKTAMSQFGTLGGGNYFCELCLDENDDVWLMLHSGSRGVGNKLASWHIDKASGAMAERLTDLEDKDLAYFVEGTEEFQAYIADMLWAQDYAAGSRDRMMKIAIAELAQFLGRETVIATEWISCHHNFCVQERHDGRDLYVTRKGAIRAQVGDRGVIPGSMGTGSYVVTGLGDPRSFNSSSHGAGRTLGRKAAERQYGVEDLREAMKGRVWNESDAAKLIDEIPAAYKDIEAVMEAQSGLVRIDHKLRSILNMKGTT